jgi:pimeloyl-ACP methyl ester carboxylesterase
MLHSMQVYLIRHWAPIFLLTSAAFAQVSPPKPLGDLVDLGGRRIHMLCAGTGSPTVLLENGGGSSSVEWTMVQQLVAKTMRICAYDRAGYAWSEHGSMDEGIEQAMDDLHLLVRKSSIKTPFIVVCQSLGCIFARAYQRRFPDQVGAFVFVDGTHDEGVTLALDGKRIPISLLSREQLPKAYEEYRRSLPALSPGSASDPPFDRLSRDLQNARHWAFEKMVQEIGWLPNSVASAESWREEFSALRQQRLETSHPLGSLPLVVLERTKDTNEVWHAQELQLAGLSSTGRLIKAEGSGHMIHLERPDLIASAITQVAAQSGTQH